MPGKSKAHETTRSTHSTDVEVPQLLRNIVRKNSETPMAVVRNLIILEANEACVRLLGARNTEELRGMSGSILLAPSSVKEAMERFERRSKGELLSDAHVYNVTRFDGRPIRLEVSTISWPTDPAMTLSIGRDITERKRAEETLRQAHEDLSRAYNLQREFLNNVTHEVRTPLTAIMGYVNMLLEGIAGPVNEEQQSMLRKTLTSSQTLLGIVDDVLETARMKSGAMLPRPSACNPCQIVENAVAAVLPQARQKKIDVEFECLQDGLTGVYDAEKLRAIVTNLIANAVKFTDKGDVRVTISSDEHGTEIIIADTGIGIPADKLATIFGEFQQLDQPRKHKPSGFGLGLAIAAKMVDTIGATLTVSSEKGTGTAFTLYVPVLAGRTSE